MKAIQRVMNYIAENIKASDINQMMHNVSTGISAYDIEADMGIVRNNASTLLNQLNKEGKLIKIVGRPVKFIPREILGEAIGDGLIKDVYNQEEIKGLLTHRESVDPFIDLVGYNHSLKSQIGKAKAAIMYPTNGLNMLILGETGVGKTTFAKKMYEYAMIQKGLSKHDYPFISFNCSDYYSNPQLLISQLFGHVKGAYTGADSDKVGLVERANGGILFLDEIHRLPPEGQEMLFYLMDSGKYKRLGESDRYRHSDVLIIASTTEEPSHNLLKTFVRRIPVHITLPALRDKGIGERIAIIEYLFREEAKRLNQRINIEPEVLKVLAMYECKGNIGELYSDIKLVCAKGYLSYLQHKENIDIKFSMLPKEIKASINNIYRLDNSIQEYLNLYNQTIVIGLQDDEDKIDVGEDLYFKDLHDRLLDIYRSTPEDTTDRSSYEIQRYLDVIIKEYKPYKLSVKELYRVLDKNIVDTTVELIDMASLKLQKNFSKRLLYGLAFYINGLVSQIDKDQYKLDYNYLEKQNRPRRDYDIKGIIEKIEEDYDIEIPNIELTIINEFLKCTMYEPKDRERVGLLIITHGEGIATGLAKVCNDMLKTDCARGLDMPLSSSIEEVYQRAVEIVKRINRGMGVLILVDMGSIIGFSDKITKDTGIPTQVINNVTTTLALDALRRISSSADNNLDDIYKALISNRKDKKDMCTGKQRAIISVCATGKGTSMVVKETLKDILAKHGINNIEILPLDYTMADAGSREYLRLQGNYEILACVGSFKPNIDLPFYFITEVISDQMRNQFIEYLDTKVDTNLEKPIAVKEKENNVFNEAKDILEKNLLFINVSIAITYIETCVNSICLAMDISDRETIFNLAVHICCLIERVLLGNRIVFEGLEELRIDNEFIFNTIRSEVTRLEDIYNIDISDDEIGYIIKIIKR